MLQRAGGRERLTNLELSLELSIQGPRMTEPAKRLLSLLGLLPDGVAREDMFQLLPEEGDEAASVLRKVGLAIPHDVRLRVLAPVREYVQRRYPPQTEDLDRTIDHYLKLAELGKRTGWEGGAEAIQRLAPETGNLEAMILRALERSDPVSGIQAARALGELFRFTGLGSARPLEQAKQSAAALGEVQLEANCLESLGDIALDRSDHDTARASYEQAIPLYKRVSELHGEAICIARLAGVALLISDYDTARASYEQAMPLFQRVGSMIGEANCIKGLGDIALRRFDHDTARASYKQAIPSISALATCSARLYALRSSATSLLKGPITTPHAPPTSRRCPSSSASAP